jgi:hypothetical protein
MRTAKDLENLNIFNIVLTVNEVSESMLLIGIFGGIIQNL